MSTDETTTCRHGDPLEECVLCSPPSTRQAQAIRAEAMGLAADPQRHRQRAEAGPGSPGFAERVLGTERVERERAEAHPPEGPETDPRTATMLRALPHEQVHEALDRAERRLADAPWTWPDSTGVGTETRSAPRPAELDAPVRVVEDLLVGIAVRLADQPRPLVGHAVMELDPGARHFVATWVITGLAAQGFLRLPDQAPPGVRQAEDLRRFGPIVPDPWPVDPPRRDDPLCHCGQESPNPHPYSLHTPPPGAVGG